MAYQKTGFQDLLEFDPDRGVVKYGGYEMFADKLGIKPEVNSIKFKDWLTMGTGGAQSAQGYQDRQKLTEKDFLNDITANGIPKPDPMNGLIPKATAGVFHKVEKDGGAYKVTTYNIPQEIDLVNKIGEAGNQLNMVTRDQALNKENATNQSSRKQGAASTQLLRDTPKPNVASRTLLSS